jgi:hypothetical protein
MPMPPALRFDPHQHRAGKSRVKLPQFLAIMLESLLDERPSIRIQHRDRLLSSV